MSLGTLFHRRKDKKVALSDAKHLMAVGYSTRLIKQKTGQFKGHWLVYAWMPYKPLYFCNDRGRPTTTVEDEFEAEVAAKEETQKALSIQEDFEKWEREHPMIGD